MLRIVCSSHKGGVGKTTITANLSSYMLDYYKKILVIDMDPQANLTTRLLSGEKPRMGIADILKAGVAMDLDKDDDIERFHALVKRTTIDIVRDNGVVSIIGSSRELAKAKLELAKYENIIVHKSIDIFKQLSNDYDLVLIDTPPSIEMLTAVSVHSCNYLLLTTFPDRDSFDGVWETIEAIVPTGRKYFNSGLKILGVLLTGVQQTKIIQKNVNLAKVEFGKALFNTHLTRSVQVGDGATLGGTVKDLYPGKKSDTEFRAIAREIRYRLKSEESYDPPEKAE